MAADFYIFETVGFALELVNEETGEPVDLTGYKKVIVSMRQGMAFLEKVNQPVDTESGIVTLYLSQSDTGRFREGTIELQVNVYFDSTERDVSCKGTLTAKDNLHKRVIT